MNFLIRIASILVILSYNTIPGLVFAVDTTTKIEPMIFLPSLSSIEWSQDSVTALRDTTKSRIISFSRPAKLSREWIIISKNTIIKLPQDICTTTAIIPSTTILPSPNKPTTSQITIKQFTCSTVPQIPTIISQINTPQTETIKQSVSPLSTKITHSVSSVSSVLPDTRQPILSIPEDIYIVREDGQLFSGWLIDPFIITGGTMIYQSYHNLALDRVVKAWANQPIRFIDKNNNSKQIPLYIPTQDKKIWSEYPYSYSHDGQRWMTWGNATIIWSGWWQRARIMTDHCTYFAIAGVTGEMIILQSPTPTQNQFITGGAFSVSAIISGAAITGVNRWMSGTTNTSGISTSLYDSWLRLMLNMNRTNIEWDTGTNIRDMSLGRLSSTIWSSTTFTGWGRYSGGYTFVNNPNSEVTIANTWWINFTWAYTISAWIRPITFSATSIIMGKQPWNNADWYKLVIDQISANTGRLVTEIRSTNSALNNTRFTGYSIELNLNQRYHVVWVYSDAGNYMATYINGQLNSFQSTTGVMATADWSFKLWEEPYNNNNKFVWVIDEARVRNRALSQDNIQEEMRSNLSRISTWSRWSRLLQSQQTWLTDTWYSFAIKSHIAGDEYETFPRKVWTRKSSNNYINPIQSWLILWYDIMDDSSITYGVWSGISIINDKSPSNRDAIQSNGTFQPTRQIMPNGNPLMMMDGINDTVTFSEANTIRTAIIVAFESAGTTWLDKSILSHTTIEPDFHRGQSARQYQDNFRWSPSIRDGQAYLNWSLFSHTGTAVSNTLAIYSIRTLWNVKTNQIWADRNFADRNWSGGYAEVLLYNTVLSESQRKEVECYLWAKRSINTSHTCTPLPSPSASIIYSTTWITSNNVTAFLTWFASGVTITNNGWSPSYVFTGNGSFTFQFINQFGVTGNAVSTVSWIYDIPVTTGMQLWLDATDTSTLSLVGNEVWERRDKSNNGNIASAENGTFRPTRIIWWRAGNNTIRFDGAQRYLRTPDITSVRTIFWVWFENTGVNNSLSPMIWHTSQQSLARGTGRLILSSTNASTNILNGSQFFNGNQTNLTTISLPSTMTLVSMVTSGAVSTNLIWSDRLIAGRYRQWDMGEIIIYDRPLSQSERVSIECYLTTKWSLSTACNTTGVLVPIIQTGINLGTRSPANIIQTITGSFTDLIGVTDTIGRDSGYYTTLQITNLSGTFQSLSSSLVSIRSTSGVILISGDANSAVQILPALSWWTSLSWAITWIYRNTAPNALRRGSYGIPAQLRVDIPAYTRPWSYNGIITYTLIEL